MLDVATRYRDSGLSVVATGRDKLPLGSWKQFQSTRPTDQQLRAMFSNDRAMGVAAIGGPVSGGLYVIDVDVPELYVPLCDRSQGAVDDLAHQQTGGGGYQIAFRCEEPPRNQKYAWVKDAQAKSGRRIAIESRGEGGYAILPPSLHPSGGTYRVVRGDFEHIPMISMEQALSIIEAARSLNQVVDDDIGQRAYAKGFTSSDAPSVVGEIIQRFRRQTPLRSILSSHGYTESGRWRFKRPGGKSASVIIIPEENDLGEASYHFSSNDMLSDEDRCPGASGRPLHDAFSVFLHLEHGSSFWDAIEHAASIVGMPFERRSSPSIIVDDPVVTAEGGAYTAFEVQGSRVLVLTDSVDSAVALRKLGVAAVAGPRAAWDAEWIDFARQANHRFVWFAPPAHWTSENLAEEVDGLLVPAHSDPASFIRSRNASLIDIRDVLQSAIPGVWDVGIMGSLKK